MVPLACAGLFDGISGCLVGYTLFCSGIEVRKVSDVARTLVVNALRSQAMRGVVYRAVCNVEKFSDVSGPCTLFVREMTTKTPKWLMNEIIAKLF